MKKAVRIITAAAFLLVITGGSALDSKELLVPMLMIVPGLAWLSVVAWVNR